MPTTAPTLAAGALTLLLCAACSAPSARLHAGFLQSELTGDLALSGSVRGVSANISTDVESGLGLVDAAGSLYTRAELDPGPVRLTASAFRYDQTGNGRLQADFGGISAGADVASDIRLGTLKGAISIDLIDVGPVRISPGVGADLFALDATVTESLTGQTERIDELLPVPMVFVQGEVDVGPVSVTLDVGGMDGSYDKFRGTFFDVEGLVLFSPVENVEVFAGYRWIAMDSSGSTDGQDYAADLNLSGWFLGGGLRF